MIILLIFVLLIIPLIFQYHVGSKAVHGYISLKFWQVCAISIFGQVGMIVISFFLMIYQLKLIGAKDGLALGGVIVIGSLIGIIILVIMGIQMYTRIDD